MYIDLFCSYTSDNDNICSEELSSPRDNFAMQMFNQGRRVSNMVVPLSINLKHQQYITFKNDVCQIITKKSNGIKTPKKIVQRYSS